MRALTLAVLIIGLFASSQALDLVDLGKDLISQLKDTAVQTVSSLVETGKQALTKAGTDLLQSLLNSVAIGKRALLTDTIKEKVGSVVSTLGGLLDKAKDAGAGLFKSALDKLHELTGKLQERIGSISDSKQTDAAIDAVVADHDQKQKRLVSELIAHGKNLVSGLITKAKDLASKAKALASQAVSGILQKGVNLIGRRGLTDHLQTIGNAISSAVSPFKDTISGLGNTLKGHFSNLVDTVKGHVNTLKGKLSGHIDDLKGHGQKLLDHGKNALGALSEVVTDILKQTLTNATPHIEGASKTLADAGNTVVNHITG